MYPKRQTGLYALSFQFIYPPIHLVDDEQEENSKSTFVNQYQTLKNDEIETI